MQDERPRFDRDTEPARLAVDRLIHPVESEPHKPSALATAQVVALGFARVGGEVAGLAIAELEPVHEPVAVKQLERLVDARPRDVS